MSEARKKEITEIVQGLGIENFNINLTNNGHYRITSELLKREVFTGSTPSDRRADLNLKSEIRREITIKVKSIVPKVSQYSDDDIAEIITEYKDHGDASKIKRKYKISGNTLSKWRKLHGLEIGKRGVSKGTRRENVAKKHYVSNDTKNGVLRRWLKGEKIADIANDYPNMHPKTMYAWTDSYKLRGFYPITAKSLSKETLGRDVSFMKSGKDAFNNKPFEDALATFASMVDKIREQSETIIKLQVEKDELRAKLEMISEAINL